MDEQIEKIKQLGTYEDKLAAYFWFGTFSYYKDLTSGSLTDEQKEQIAHYLDLILNEEERIRFQNDSKDPIFSSSITKRLEQYFYCHHCYYTQKKEIE